MLAYKTGLLPLVAFASVMHVSTLQAASFDCGKATRPVENTICNDIELSALDEYLDRYYRAARATLERGSQCLRLQQREWLKEVRDRCGDADCLRQAYLMRLTALDALQPGATELRHIDLPSGPRLIGILPPAEDEVAAPRGGEAKPIEIRGRIVDDLENGDGYVLQEEDGTNYLLRPLMFIEPADAAMLTSAAADSNARFLVQGFVASDEDAAFDVSRCIFIHRLPPR